MALVLRAADLEAILTHARDAAPAEACGVIGGTPQGSDRRVEVVRPCRNAAASPEWEYVAEPHDQLRAFLEIEDGLGLEVLGFYHSHPKGPAGPSAIDAARAAYEDASYLVMWLAPREGWGSWRWQPPAFELEDVVLTP